MTIFAVGLLSSLGAGAAMQTVGWPTMNVLLLPWLGLAALAVIWLGWRRRLPRAAA